MSKQKHNNEYKAMENIAERYADELNAQFRTLNYFVKHAGEIGRAHESFFRGILARFLADDIRISSGFVASENWTSSQQDILLHKRDYSTFFKVGDCTVIDYQAFIGTIEVKTELTSKIFQDAIEKNAKLRKQLGRGLYALFAWDGISFDKAKKSLWSFVEDAPKNFMLMPDVVYVRGKYFLMANKDGKRETPPFQIWRIGKNGITDGQALLGLVNAVWRFGLSFIPPWWLSNWDKTFGTMLGKSKNVPWPKNLKKKIMADLKHTNKE